MLYNLPQETRKGGRGGKEDRKHDCVSVPVGQIQPHLKQASWVCFKSQVTSLCSCGFIAGDKGSNLDFRWPA